MPGQQPEGRAGPVQTELLIPTSTEGKTLKLLLLALLTIPRAFQAGAFGFPAFFVVVAFLVCVFRSIVEVTSLRAVTLWMKHQPIRKSVTT